MTKHYFEKGVHKENDFIKSSLLGKTSKVNTLEELRVMKPWIAKNKVGCFGRTIKDAKEKGWAIHLYYGYENVDDITSLWYGIRWIRKLPVTDV